MGRLGFRLVFCAIIIWNTILLWLESRIIEARSWLYENQPRNSDIFFALTKIVVFKSLASLL